MLEVFDYKEAVDFMIKVFEGNDEYVEYLHCIMQALDLAFADSNLKVGYATHKRMIDERDEMIAELNKKIDKIANELFFCGVELMCYSDTKKALQLACEELESYSEKYDEDAGNAVLDEDEWKDYLLKQVSKDEKG